MASNKSIDVSLNPDFSLKIELGTYEKEVLMNRLVEISRQHNKMGAWMDNLKVPKEEKEKYLPCFINLIESVGLLMKILKCAGIPEKDIIEAFEIPF